MNYFFALVIAMSYLAALACFAAGKSDGQLIAGAVFATCGTVALVGLALLNRITALALLKEKKN